MSGWPTVPLGSVADFIRGVTFKPTDVVPVGEEGSVACMRTKNVQTELDCSDVWGLRERLVKHTAQFLETGDILVSSANSWNLVGKCSWIPELPWRATFGGFVSVLRPQRTKVYPRFLFRWFSSDKIQAIVRSFGQKTTNISNLNIKRCLNLSFPLPPMSEQRRIADILDRAEALLNMRRDALADLNDLVQAIFIDMFDDLERHEWPMATVEDVSSPARGSIRTGPFGSQLLHGEFTDEGVAVLGIDNAVLNEFCWGKKRFISQNKYTQLKKYTVNPGDVLITIMGTCGRCAIVPDDIPVAINTKHLCCISLDRKKCTPSFLHAYFLMHPLARRYLDKTAKGAIMDGLNMGIIKAMPIPIVPLPLQQEFDRYITSVEKLRISHRASQAELNDLFSSLQHRAFRGEL